MSCREINFSISFLSFLIFSLHCHVFALEKSHLKVQQIFLAGMGNREAGTHNPITFLFPAPHSTIFPWHKPDALSLSASIKLRIPWSGTGLLNSPSTLGSVWVTHKHFGMKACSGEEQQPSHTHLPVLLSLSWLPKHSLN